MFQEQRGDFVVENYRPVHWPVHWQDWIFRADAGRDAGGSRCLGGESSWQKYASRLDSCMAVAQNSWRNKCPMVSHVISAYLYVNVCFTWQLRASAWSLEDVKLQIWLRAMCFLRDGSITHVWCIKQCTCRYLLMVVLEWFALKGVMLCARVGMVITT